MNRSKIFLPLVPVSLFTPLAATSAKTPGSALMRREEEFAEAPHTHQGEAGEGFTCFVAVSSRATGIAGPVTPNRGYLNQEDNWNAGWIAVQNAERQRRIRAWPALFAATNSHEDFPAREAPGG